MDKNKLYNLITNEISEEKNHQYLADEHIKKEKIAPHLFSSLLGDHNAQTVPLPSIGE